MQSVAYSLLSIKSVDQARRRFSGIATTPTPDAHGDIVEPLGVSFSNPLPLLLYHDPQRPVGKAWFRTPTAEGIPFDAEIPTLNEAGPLKDRLDEAWGSVKVGLISGVSIKISSTPEKVKRLANGGIHWLKSYVSELSLVTIPANRDASILTVKSLAPASAALGIEDGRSYRPGATGTSAARRTKDASRMAKTLTELKSELAASVSRLEELTGLQDHDDDQRQELAELPGAIKGLTDQVTNAQTLQAAKAALAVPVGTVKSSEDGTRTREGVEVEHIAATTQINRPKEMGFVRYVLCKSAAFLHGMSPLEIAKARYPSDTQLISHFKTAVAAALPSNAGWAGNLIYPTNLASEFIEFLRPTTIIGKFGTGNIPSLRRIPFNVRMASQTVGGTGYWVGAGTLKPMTRLTTDTASLGFAKAAALTVISQEIARFSSPSAEAIVRDDLSAAVREVLDRDFIDPDKAAVANVSPASITRGITPLTTSGTDADAVRADVQQVLAAFIAANITPTNGVWIMPQTLALTLSLMRNPLGQKEFPDITMMGGTFEGFPVITSQYAVSGSPESNLLIFVNASDIFYATDDVIDVKVSDQTSIRMSDDPTSDSTIHAVSMFQSNQLAILAEIYANWARRRTESVQLLNNVAYASGSPTS